MEHIYADIENKATIQGFSLEDDLWMITGVEVNRYYRGRGAASRLLSKVIQDADRENIDLVLSIQSDGTGLDDTALEQFYARNGFELIEESAMIRKAVKIEVQ